MKVLIISIFISYFYSGYSLAQTSEALDPFFNDELQVYFSSVKPKVLLMLDHTCSMGGDNNGDGCSRTAQLKTALIGNDAKVNSSCKANKLSSKNYGVIDILHKWVDFAAYGFNGNHKGSAITDKNEITFPIFGFDTDYSEQKTSINKLKDESYSEYPTSDSRMYRRCGTPMTRAMLMAGMKLKEKYDKNTTPSCQTHHVIELGDGRPTVDNTDLLKKFKISSSKEIDCVNTKGKTYKKACTKPDSSDPKKCVYTDDDDTRSDEGIDVACASKALYKEGNFFQTADQLDSRRITSDAIGFDMDQAEGNDKPAAVYHNMAREGSAARDSAYIPERVDSLVEDLTDSILKRILSSLPKKANRFSKIGVSYDKNYPSADGYVYLASFAPPKDVETDAELPTDPDSVGLEGNIWRGNVRKYKLFPKINDDGSYADYKSCYPPKVPEEPCTDSLLQWNGKTLVMNKDFRNIKELWSGKRSVKNDGEKACYDSIVCGGAGRKMVKQMESNEPPPVYTWLPGSPDSSKGEWVRFNLDNKASLRESLQLDNNDSLEKYINYVIGWKWKKWTKGAADFVENMKRAWPLGAIIHSSPIVLKYEKVTYIVVGSNDGKLHFIYDNPKDEADENNGKIKLSIIPQDLLPSLKEFYDQPNVKYEDDGVKKTSIIKYGVDGEISLLHRDKGISEEPHAPKNGWIDPAEKAVLVFGLGRGGAAYYVMDVSQLDTDISELKDSVKPLGKSEVFPINYLTHIQDDSFSAKNISALRDSWSEPTITQTPGTGGLYDVAFVGSGHQKFFDRDYNNDETKISLPKQIKGSKILDADDSYDCLDAVDKDMSISKGAMESQNKKFCKGNGKYWDSKNYGNDGSWGKPFPGYPWDKEIGEQTTGSSTKYSNPETEHGIDYKGENARPTFKKDVKGACVASSSPPPPTQPYGGPVTCNSPYECEGHDVFKSCCSEYECHTCFSHHVTDKWEKTCTIFDGYRYFYNTKSKTKDANNDDDLKPEEWVSTKRKFSIQLKNVIAYQIVFDKLSLGENDKLKITNKEGVVLQTITGSSTSSSDWFYGNSVNLVLQTSGGTGKVKRDAADKIIIDESGKVVRPSESTSSWGSGISISKINVKRMKEAPTGHSTYPSIFIFNLGEAEKTRISPISLPPGVPFNTFPDDSRIFKRFTHSCPILKGNNCVDKSDFPDLTYMVFPISAKISVIEKGAIFDKAFIGDEGGQIWKIEQDSSKWKISRVFYPYDKSSDPTTSTLYADGSNGLRKIFAPIEAATADCAIGPDAYALYFGTGDVQRPKMDRTKKDIIGMVIVDSKTKTLTIDDLEDISGKAVDKPVNLKKTGKRGWYIKLDDNGKMIRGAKVFNKTAHYKVFYPVTSGKTDEEKCAEVQSEEKLFAVNYCSGTGAIEETDAEGKIKYSRTKEYSSDSKKLSLGMGAELQFFRTEKNQTLLMIDNLKSPATKEKEKPIQILDWIIGE